jgi:site-specific recombinase XerD
MLEWSGFQEIPTADFPRLAAKYLNETRDAMSAKTTERRITALRAYGKFIGVTVLEDYKGPKPARSMPHPLPEGMAGVARMAEVAQTNEHRALIGLLGYNGLRVGESLTVSFSSFDLQNMMLLVRGKGQKERLIPLSQRCWELCTPLLIDNMNTPQSRIIALAESSARKAITAIGKRAGICRSVASHDLRHTIATDMLNRTGNLRLVQEFLGHSSITTTQVYTHVELQAMREAMNAA